MVLPVLVLCGVSGCLPDIGGYDPPSNELIFPVGVATTKNDRHLLVVNSNFDLRYNNGTLMALDLSRLNGAGSTQSNSDGTSFDKTRGIYTVTSSLDSFCDPGGYDNYCHIDVKRWSVPKETIRLGAYASDLQMSPDGEWAVIPVRGERSIIVVRVDETGNELLNCGADSGRDCASSHRISSGGGITMPIEPYTVATMEYRVPVRNNNGEVTGEVVETMGAATHLSGGEVSLFSIASRTKNGDATVDARLVNVIGGVVEGASGIAANPLTNEMYVAGRRDPYPHVAVLQVLTNLDSGGSYLNNPWFSQTATISIANEIYGGTEARSVAVSPLGDTAFVLTQEPPALLKLNLETYKTVDMTTVCAEPSRVKTHLVKNDPDDPLDDQVFAFVLCFMTGQVYIVDTRLMTSTVRVTGSGPQDIAFDATRELAYIANFSESTITVIQSEPPFNQVRVRSADAPDVLKTIRIGEPGSTGGKK